MDIAALGVTVTGNGIDTTARSLDNLTQSTGKAETATESLGVEAKQTDAAVGALGKEANTTAGALRTLAAAGEDGIATVRTIGTTWVDTGNKVKRSAGLQTTELLNLSRQFADIGVSAAGGMNPLMILIQQGPQIADVFATARMRGVGLSQALAGLAAAAAPAAAAVAAIGAVVGVVAGAFALMNHDLNEKYDNKAYIKSLDLTDAELKKLGKTTITTGDMFKGLWMTIDEGQRFSKFFKDLGKWAVDAFRTVLDAGQWAISGIYGGWVGGVKGIIEAVKNLPAITGDVFISAANLAITGVEMMVNGAIGRINQFIGFANNIPGVALNSMGNVDLPSIANPYAGSAGKALGDGMKYVTEETLKARKAQVDFWKDVGANADKARDQRIAKGLKGVMDARGDKSGKGDTPLWMQRLDPTAIDVDKTTREQIGRVDQDITSLGNKIKLLPGILDPVREKADEIRRGVSGFAQDLAYGIGDAAANITSWGDAVTGALQRAWAQWVTMKAMGFLGIAADGSTIEGGRVDKVGDWLGKALDFGGFREAGGPVTAGRAYVVGEKQPELFVPRTSGHIVPQVPQMQSAGGMNFAPNININGEALTQRLMDGINAVVADNRRYVERQIDKKVPAMNARHAKIRTYS